MNAMRNQMKKMRAAAWFGGLLGLFLLGGGLSWWLVARTAPPDLDAARARERERLRRELQRADQAALSSAAVLDAARGIYRIPIQDAMKLMRARWADPAAGRADLLERVTRATAPLPEPVNIYDL